MTEQKRLTGCSVEGQNKYWYGFGELRVLKIHVLASCIGKYFALQVGFLITQGTLAYQPIPLL